MKTSTKNIHQRFIGSLLILVLGNVAHLSAQNSQKKINQLKKELLTTTDSKKKATLYSDLTWYYGNVSVDSALSYGKKALLESNQLKDSVLIAQVNSDIASAYFNKSDFKNSETHYLKALQIRAKKNDVLGINKIKVNLGNVYRKTFRHELSMKNYIEALQYFEDKNAPVFINIIKANMGLLFTDTKNYDKAQKYLKEAVLFFEDKKDEGRLCENYMNLGQVYQYQNNYKEAEIYYKKSLDKCTQTSNKRGISYAYRNLGSLHILQNKDSLAKINIEKSALARKEFNSAVDIASINSEVAKGYTDDLNYQKAKNILLKQIKTLETQKSYKDLKKFYPQLVQTYSHLGKPDSADYYLRKFEEIIEITGKESVAKQTSELETKYQTAKKDNEILEQKSKIFKKNVTLLSLLGLLVAAGITFFSLFRHRQKNEKIKLQKEILRQQDLATKAVMNAEDNERKRMATHLHDGIGQLLSAANMNVSVLDDYKEDQSAFTKVLDKTKSILNEAITDVRSLSHQIMPNMLIKNSLSNALRELIEKSNSPKLNITLKIEGLNDTIDQNIQVVLYRIIQECINNTIKHAEASAINVSVIQDAEKIYTSISDNGKGFNPMKVQSKNEGLGLENIKSRIEVLKGNIKISSKEGEGTSIFVEIPLI